MPRTFPGPADNAHYVKLLVCTEASGFSDLPRTGSYDSEVPQVGIFEARTRAQKRRYLAPGIALVAVAAVGGWWLAYAHRSSGDPGGRILNQLVPAAEALPGYGTDLLPWTSSPASGRPYLLKSEPRIESCDGMSGTTGWSEAAVQGLLRWDGSGSRLFAVVDSRLDQLGWRRESIPATNEAVWNKQLSNGSSARAVLSLSPSGGSFWEFVALAPPTGKAASGC